MDCIKRAMAMARAMALSSCITIVHYEYSQYLLSMAYCHFSPKFKSTGVEKKKTWRRTQHHRLPAAAGCDTTSVIYTAVYIRTRTTTTYSLLSL